MRCDHCDEIACTPARDGFYHEGMSDRCEACGFPGHVVIDGEDPDPEENSASWVTSDALGARCHRPNCTDGCVERT